MTNLATYVSRRCRTVNETLTHYLPGAKTEETRARVDPVANYRAAIRDAIHGAGKRIRPILVLAVADLLRRPHADVEPLAVAVEFIHCASLALDDLPCMDDAKLRRGRPALHVKYGEPAAILAAMALLMESVAIVGRGLATSRLGASERTRVVEMVGATVGFDGMPAGQAADLAAMGPGAPLSVVEFVHRRKTGLLFDLALSGAAILCRAGDADAAALGAYGKNLGLAFQVKDDLLDVEGDANTLGKDARMDVHKTTFVDLAGVDAARHLLVELTDTAIASLSMFGDRAKWLRDLVFYVRDRRR